MIIYNIDMVILNIDIGYGLMILWEMTVSIWSSLDINMAYLFTLPVW